MSAGGVGDVVAQWGQSSPDEATNVCRVADHLLDKCTGYSEGKSGTGRIVVHNGMIQGARYNRQGKRILRCPLSHALTRANLHLVKNPQNRYWVCEKSDGERYFLFVHHRSSPRAYLISRKRKVCALNGATAQALHNSILKAYPLAQQSEGYSLLDGELMLEMSGSPQQNPFWKPAARPVYMCFDAVVVSNQWVKWLRLPQRLSYVQAIVKQARSLLSLSSDSVQFSMQIKSFVEASPKNVALLLWGVTAPPVKPWAQLVAEKSAPVRSVYRQLPHDDDPWESGELFLRSAVHDANTRRQLAAKVAASYVYREYRSTGWRANFNDGLIFTPRDCPYWTAVNPRAPMTPSADFESPYVLALARGTMQNASSAPHNKDNAPTMPTLKWKPSDKVSIDAKLYFRDIENTQNSKLPAYVMGPSVPLNQRKRSHHTMSSDKPDLALLSVFINEHERKRLLRDFHGGEAKHTQKKLMTGSLRGNNASHKSSLVYELAYVRELGSWRILKPRFDKAEGNFYTVAVHTMRSLMDNIGPRDFSESQ